MTHDSADQRGMVAKRIATRCSWGLLALGAVIAITAASIGGVQISQTGTCSTSIASLRTAGGVTLTAGLSLLLFAQRIPALMRAWVSYGGPADMRSRSSIGVPLVILVFVLAFGTLGLWTLPFLLPGFLNFLLTYLLLLFLPVVLVTICVYGRGWMRTFCIGALLPAAIGVIGIALFSGMLLQAIFRSYGSLVRELSKFGEANPAGPIIWTLCLAAGTVSIITRLILHVLTPPVAEATIVDRVPPVRSLD